MINCQHNVIFEKIGEITTTKSKWLVTFVIDLKLYQEFIYSLKCDLSGAIIIVVCHCTGTGSPWIDPI